VTASEARYADPEAETMSRADIASVQEAKLLDLIPYAYERSALVRSTWEAAGVRPRDVRSLDDFRERVPFIDKDAIRRFRDDHHDPYGGTLCIDESEISAVFSTSGTTGDPTLVAESVPRGHAGPGAALRREFWEMGVRPDDRFAIILFTFRGPGLSRIVRSMGAVPVWFDHHPDDFARLFRWSAELEPVALYSLSGPLIMALQYLAPAMGVDVGDALSCYRGIIFAGEPLGLRAKAQVDEWGVELFVHTGLGDVGAATECREHDGCHFWEDDALVEWLDVEDGRGELVATSLSDRTAPLIRYRSDDLVRLTFDPCRCGRTHGRFWPLGRKGDEVVVDGRTILPLDVWPAIEAVDECAAGLFQVIRAAREADVLRLRVGYTGSPSLSDLRDQVCASVAAAVGVAPEVELVPNDALLRLGPPHKIPRVAKA
jgi:phenylacetate-CoA ligase